MTKLINMARFTSAISPNEIAEAKKIHSPLQLAHQARHAQGEALVRVVINVLADSSQPLTADEVAAAVSQATGHEYHFTHIRQIINACVKSGKISRRLETPEERSIRAGGKAYAKQAALHWAPGIERVPARTVREAVPGFIFEKKSRGQGPSKKKKAHRTSYEQQQRLRKQIKDEVILEELPSTNNAVIDTLIDMLVKQKTQALQEELKTTKQELEELRAKVKSLLNM